MAGRFRMKVVMALVIALCLAILPGVQQLQASSAAVGSVTFTYDGMDDCTISLYYVADYSESDGYRISSDFADTAVSRQDIEDEKWYSLAMTLETLVIGYQISPVASGSTDADGQVTFTDLKEGLYLVTIESMTIGNTIYTAQPLVILIPEYDSDGSANYDEDITITKYETQEVQSTTSLSVQKVWDDEDSSVRPTSLTVYLLEGTDGTIADTQVLDDSNNWRYSWSDLDGSDVWYVMEEELEDYGVSYSSADDGTIVLTNQQGTGKTHSMETIPPDDEDSTELITEETESDTETEETETLITEESSDSETESESAIESGSSEDMIYSANEDSESSESDTEAAAGSESGDSSGSSQSAGSSGTNDGSGTSSQSSSNETLPQTGASWWKVLLLTGAAIVCFLLGIRKDAASRRIDK